MKQLVTILSLLTFFSAKTFGQQGTISQINEKLHPISYFLDVNVPSNEISSSYDMLLTKLKEKKSKAKSERQFVQSIFSYIHNKQLNRYTNYVTLSRVFQKGKQYDCVTGTALYALIFNDLGFSYTIKEFKFHALLIVHTDKGDILLESTDPTKGFVSSPIEIENRLSYYTEVTPDNNGIIKPVASREDMAGFQKDITLTELAGLQYYNAALHHLNLNDLTGALINISKAHSLYPCERVKAMRSLIWKYSNEISLAVK